MEENEIIEAGKDTEVIENESSIESVKKDDEKLINDILKEKDADKLKDLTQLFNLFQTKRNILRINALNDVQDALVQQMVDRLATQPHNFDNKDIALWVKTVQQAMDASKQSVEKIETIQPIINQNNTQINVSVEDSLDRESREKVLSILENILGKNDQNNKKDDDSGVLYSDEIKTEETAVAEGDMTSDDK